MIDVQTLTFRYGSTTIFEDFSWQVGDHESWAVVGPSGCGKSTLLYLIAGLRQPSSGTIRVREQAVRRPRPETGLILQDYGLVPWRTVRQNVQLGLDIRRLYGPDGKHAPRDFDPAASNGSVDNWLERLGITAQADKYPGHVSGGQRQRAAIARTLVLNPDLLLMDEPFSSLDAPTREGLQAVVADLQRETGITVLVVTHSIEEAVFLGRKILVLGPDLPTCTPRFIDNPAAASPGFRSSSGYMEQCVTLRKLMGLQD